MCPLDMHCMQFFLFDGFMYKNSDKMCLKHKTVLIDSSMSSGVETHPAVHQPLLGHHCASHMVHPSSAELQEPR